MSSDEERGLLEGRISEQRRQLRIANEALQEKNLELDAMHYVWCDGGCEGGAHRWTEGEITEDLVARAERQARRLRAWFENRKSRDARGDGLMQATVSRESYGGTWRCKAHNRLLPNGRVCPKCAAEDLTCPNCGDTMALNYPGGNVLSCPNDVCEAAATLEDLAEIRESGHWQGCMASSCGHVTAFAGWAECPYCGVADSENGDRCRDWNHPERKAKREKPDA